MFLLLIITNGNNTCVAIKVSIISNINDFLVILQSPLFLESTVF